LRSLGRLIATQFESGQESVLRSSVPFRPDTASVFTHLQSSRTAASSSSVANTTTVTLGCANPPPTKPGYLAQADKNDFMLKLFIANISA
jgi:hypothetical protein